MTGSGGGCSGRNGELYAEQVLFATGAFGINVDLARVTGAEAPSAAEDVGGPRVVECWLGADSSSSSSSTSTSTSTSGFMDVVDDFLGLVGGKKGQTSSVGVEAEVAVVCDDMDRGSSSY